MKNIDNAIIRGIGISEKKEGPEQGFGFIGKINSHEQLKSFFAKGLEDMDDDDFGEMSHLFSSEDFNRVNQYFNALKGLSTQEKINNLKFIKDIVLEYGPMITSFSGLTYAGMNLYQTFSTPGLLGRMNDPSIASLLIALVSSSVLAYLALKTPSYDDSDQYKTNSHHWSGNNNRDWISADKPSPEFKEEARSLIFQTLTSKINELKAYEGMKKKASM